MAEASQTTDATAGTTCSDADTARVVFLVEVRGAPDALARVLTPFAVLQVELVFVELRRTERGASIRIEAEGLDVHRSQLLARRLEQAPTVLSVGLGWRSRTDPHGARRDDPAFPETGNAWS